MGARRCSRCQWATPAIHPNFPVPSIYNALPAEARLEVTLVQCNRYPPQLVDRRKVIWAKPLLELNDWCGEFKDRMEGSPESEDGSDSD